MKKAVMGQRAGRGDFAPPRHEWCRSETGLDNACGRDYCNCSGINQVPPPEDPPREDFRFGCAAASPGPGQKARFI